jgi:transcriptional regulator with XRE-family HTH domain
MNNLDRILKEMDPARRKRIEARAAELIAEERSLQELRKARKLTQETIADTLGIGQDNVSRLEQRNDLLVSTVRGYVEALGGKLSLIAEFPNQPPVVLTGIAGPQADRNKRPRKAKVVPRSAGSASARRAGRR